MTSTISYSHQPILTSEILSYIPQRNNMVIVDCTTGEGGHSELILSQMPGGTIITLDRDLEILNIAYNRLNQVSNKNTLLITRNNNYSQLDSVLDLLGIDKVDFVLYDLGVSMYHFKSSQRGFSFKDSNSLDMRLDNNSDLTASDVINGYSENDLADIIYYYGEEKKSRQIAKSIVQYRKNKIITNALELQDIILRAYPGSIINRKINPATKTFQALRIFINNELDHLESGLIQGIKRLSIGGRLAVISFHSLEDRIVKNIFKYYSKTCICPEEYLKCQCGGKPVLKKLTKKPITPNRNEKDTNISSRSAKLRVVEKVYETTKHNWISSKVQGESNKKVFHCKDYFGHPAYY